MSKDAPLCAGKGFEHHQQVIVPPDSDRWGCPDCGDTGSYADFEAYGKRLLCLMPLLDRLREQMLDRGAVIMVPTEAATGSLGTFMGLDVLRVPRLTEPMIAISGRARWPVAVDRDNALASFVAAMEREQESFTQKARPVSGDMRIEWKP